MAQQRRGLGKGLGALIPETPRPSGEPASAAGTPAAPAGGTAPSSAAPSASPASAPTPQVPEPVALNKVDGAYFAEVSVDAIAPNPKNPRGNFDEEALGELADSIKEVGLLQPVVVRRLEEDKYELVMGERRWRASKQAGLENIPAIVRETSDTDLLRDALLENIQRQDLDPLEEAAAYQQLLDDFGATHEQLSQKIGRSRPHITNTLRLLNLPPAVQTRVAARVLSAGHARALLGLKSPDAQVRLAQRIVAEGLSVRSVEEIVQLGNDDSDTSSRKPTAKKPVAPALAHLSDRLSDVFETRVKVQMGQKKGKIVVEFDSINDLERIVKSMAPEAATPGRGSDSD